MTDNDITTLEAALELLDRHRQGLLTDEQLEAELVRTGTQHPQKLWHTPR